MTNYLICYSEDLNRDAYEYAKQRDYIVVRDYSNIGDNDTVMIYTHGRYAEDSDGNVRSINQVLVEGRAYKAIEFCDEVILKTLESSLVGLRFIIHACFSAGTVENPPESSMNTFAGQLCSALKRFYYPGLCVIGFQGQMKQGMAGVRVDTHPSLRSTRTTISPYDGSYWRVVYGGDSDKDGLLGSGASVRWG